MSLARRIIVFVSLVVLLYLGALFATSRAGVLGYLADNPLEPGGKFHSLQRFREARASSAVDIVFFGSSHGYRGFDPRIFAAAGHRAFNLSSTNQTPLNSYHLALRHLPQLKPSTVIFEVYYNTLESDGLESFRDLAVNTPFDAHLMWMALATRHLGAINFAVAKAFGYIPDPSSATQMPAAGETYVAGGYCETTARRPTLIDRASKSVSLDERQLDYLIEASRYAMAQGARVVWVTHPFPRDHLDTIERYDRVQAKIGRAAQRADVVYWDFNDTLPLHPLEDFSDFHHLNARGVAAFNRALIARLF